LDPTASTAGVNEFAVADIHADVVYARASIRLEENEVALLEAAFVNALTVS
jgi:hypothetical protein